MSAAQILAYGQMSQSDNTTRYFAISGAVDTTSESATEADRQITIREAGVFSNLFFRVLTNTCTVTTVLMFRVNGADSALTLNITSDATGEFEDITHTVSVSAGDEVCHQLAIPTEAGTNTLTASLLAVVFTATSGTATVLSQPEALGYSQASTTRYTGLVSYNATTTEAAAQWSATQAFVGKNLFVYVSANARTTNTTIKTRKNTADGAVSVTYGNVETGIKEDTSNSDTLALDDEYCLAITTSTGTETITVQQRALTVTSASGAFPLIGTGLSSAYSPAFNVNEFNHFGKLNSASGTESDCQLLSRITCSLKHLTVDVSANTLTGIGPHIESRIGGVDGALDVLFDAAETGVKQDLSNSDALTAGSSRYCVHITTPNTSGACTIRSLSLVGESAASGFVPFPRPRGLYGGMRPMSGGMN